MVQITRSFGGGWTRQKLDVVENYLESYTRVMKNQPGFRTWYFDGFAGLGLLIQVEFLRLRRCFLTMNGHGRFRKASVDKS